MRVEIQHRGETVADLGQTPTRRGAMHLILEWARKHTPQTVKGYVRVIQHVGCDVVDYGDYGYFGRIWK